MSTTDEDKARILALELQHVGKLGPIVINISSVNAFALIACLQLAWRHPRLSPTHRTMIETFAQELAGPFADYPVANSVIRAGWDHSQDRTVGRS